MTSPHSSEAPAGAGAREYEALDRAMFWVAFVFLALVVVILPHRGPETAIADLPRFGGLAPWLLAAAWFAILAEGAWGALCAPDRRGALKRLALVALAPPFRMTVAPRRPNDSVWLPVYGWVEVSAPSLARMEQRTAIPILLATALIVPVLIADFGFAEAVETSPALQTALTALTGFIWFSFALEFVVMSALAPKKAAYCKKHWINIVIILLPLVAFLRTLRLLGFLRTAQAGKLAKAYRLRGLLQRSLKIALAFNLIERIMAMRPEKYAAMLEERIADREAELEELRRKLIEIRKRIDGE